MLSRRRVEEIVSGYDPRRLSVGVLASHSAVDVCDGAVDEGLRTIAVCEQGRDLTYSRYFKAERDADGRVVRGCVDEAWVLPRFRDAVEPKTQERLRAANALWVPNRSFTVYCGIDAVEDRFEVPVFGTRSLLRAEERTEQRDYYWILEKAGIPFPERIASPDDITELSIVKLHHAQKKLERGFFTASTPAEYREKAASLVQQGVITDDDLAKARIERYVIGPVFNFNFFRSPLASAGEAEVELLGVDWRFESSLDGHVRLPAEQQLALVGKQRIPEMTVVGHNSATVRESLLEQAFDLAERFVAATKEHYAPGIVGPFCLQTCVDKDMRFYVYDVAPRVGGGTNVHLALGHPYGNATWRRPMSTGRRVAMEIRRAAEAGRLKDVVS